MIKFLFLRWLGRCQAAGSFASLENSENDSNANHNKAPDYVIPQPCDRCELKAIQDYDLTRQGANECGSSIDRLEIERQKKYTEHRSIKE